MLATDSGGDAADAGADRGRQGRGGRQPSALQQREFALLHEIQEHPVREQIERVVHAHVGNRQQQDAAISHEVHQPPQADRGLRIGASMGGLLRDAVGADGGPAVRGPADFGQFLCRDGRMLARRIATVPAPQRDQHERRQARQQQGRLPTQGRHERSNQRRCERSAQAQAHRLQTLHI